MQVLPYWFPWPFIRYLGFVFPINYFPALGYKWVHSGYVIAKVDIPSIYNWINQLNILEVLLDILLLDVVLYQFLTREPLMCLLGLAIIQVFPIISSSPQIEMLTKLTVKYFNLIFESFLLVWLINWFCSNIAYVR